MNDGELFVVLTIALVIAFYLIKYLFIGSGHLYGWAAKQGFIGVAAYFACWIFLTGFMACACIIVGASVSWSKE